MGVVRTRMLPEPSVTYNWYTRIGYKVVGRYPDVDGRVDGRVILARDLTTLQEYLHR